MIVKDLSTAKGPTATELKMLERLGRHRRALEAAPADEEEAYVIARALATLEDMEECLCEEGPRAPDLDRGWRVVERLEARLSDLQATPAPHRPHSTGRPHGPDDPPRDPPRDLGSSCRGPSTRDAHPPAGYRRRTHPSRALAALRPKETQTC